MAAARLGLLNSEKLAHIAKKIEDLRHDFLYGEAWYVPGEFGSKELMAEQFFLMALSHLELAERHIKVAQKYV